VTSTLAWPLAMCAVFVLMLTQRTASHWPVNKLKVWATMITSWLLGVLAVGVLEDPTPSALWMVIDVGAAYLVLKTFHPISTAQKLIGTLYISMVFWHIAFVWGNHSQAPLYTWFQIVVGWLQWGVLMAWSGSDVGKAIIRRFWHHRPVATNTDTNGAGGR